MASRYLITKLGLVLALLLTPAAALADTPTPGPTPSAATEAVTKFTVTDRLSRADTLDVTEQFDYNFGAAPHPINQDFPNAFNDDQGNQLPITLKVISATAAGRSFSLKPAIQNGLTRLSFPAGSGSGTRHYSVNFTLHPVVLKGDQGDVFELSVVGLAWNVPINQATASLQVPPQLTPQNFTCTTGNGAATSSNCKIVGTTGTISVTTDAPLAPGQTLEISCGFPRGSFTSYLTSPGGSPIAFLIVLIVLVLLAGVTVGFLVRRLRRSRR